MKLTHFSELRSLTPYYIAFHGRRDHVQCDQDH